MRRTRTLPTLKRLLTPHETRNLSEEEAEERQSEHDDLIKRFNN